MDDKKIYNRTVPVLNKKEQESLDTLTARYNKLIEPSKIAKIGKKAGELVPEKIKTMAKDVGISISEQQIYSQMMDLVGKGFKTIEEQAARFSISEKQIVAKINKNSKTQISSVEEICLVRSYDIAKSLSGISGKIIFLQYLKGQELVRQVFGEYHLILFLAHSFTSEQFNLWLCSMDMMLKMIVQNWLLLVTCFPMLSVLLIMM